MAEGSYAYRLLSTATWFYAPKRTVFGLNQVLKLADELGLLGVERGSEVLAVVDPAVLNLDLVSRALKKLGESYSVDTYTDVEYEPSVECAARIAEHARSGRYRAVIGIGGGSTLDLAKVAAISMDNPDKAVEEFRGVEKVPRRSTPVIAVPTTAGTGSEVSRFAVLTKGPSKFSIVSVHVIPDAAVVDPMLTITVPPKVTAGTGLDALSHAVEGYISLLSTPLSDAVALESARLVFRYLRRAYYKGDDVEARYFMSLAATAAGIPLNVGVVVLGHSMSHTFGPQYKVHHGTACGMVLPYVLDFYLPVVPEKLAALAAAAGVDTYGLSVWEAAEEAVRATWRLVEDLEIPLTLRELGVSRGELGALAERTVREWPRPNSPIELTKENVLKVYEAMYEGRLLRVKVP